MRPLVLLRVNRPLLLLRLIGVVASSLRISPSIHTSLVPLRLMLPPAAVLRRRAVPLISRLLTPGDTVPSPAVIVTSSTACRVPSIRSERPAPKVRSRPAPPAITSPLIRPFSPA